MMALARKGCSAAKDESLQVLRFPYESFFSGKDSRGRHSLTGWFESRKGLLRTRSGSRRLQANQS
jgi:hypothetical protein